MQNTVATSLAVVGFTLAVLCAPKTTAAEELYGPACVADGDTLHINGKRTKVRCEGGTKVQLRGVDAPELAQTCQSMDGREFRCGQFAAAFLLDRIKGKEILCEGDMRAPSGVLLVACRESGGDLGRYMVETGWALADQRYSLKFVQFEEDARANRRGLWGLKFVPPKQWREGERLAQ